MDFDKIDDDLLKDDELKDLILDEDTVDFNPESKRPKKRAKNVTADVEPVKGLPCTKVGSDVENADFVADKHQFQLQLTQSLSTLGTLVELMKQNNNSTMNMTVDGEWVTLTAIIFDHTVLCSARLHKQFFNGFKFSCDKPRIMTFNIASLHHQFARMKSLDVTSLIMTGAENLEIKGFLRPDDTCPMTLTVAQLDDEVDDLLRNIPQYPATIQLDSKLFCTAIQQMVGTEFTIKMDTTRRAIVLYSSEGNESIEIPISIGEQESKELAAISRVSKFKATFKKSIFQPVIRGNKINNMLRLSMAMDEDERDVMPLQIVYPIKLGENFESKSDSLVAIYIGSSVAE